MDEEGVLESLEWLREVEAEVAVGLYLHQSLEAHLLK